MTKHNQVGNPATSPQVPDYDDDQNPTTEELVAVETKAKRKTAKKTTNTAKTSKKKATKAADAPKRGSKKKTTKKAAKSDKPAHKGGHGEFASKLDDNAGKEIEKRFTSGEGLSTIAKSMGVSINTIRFRFLQYLIKETYNFEKV